MTKSTDGGWVIKEDVISVYKETLDAAVAVGEMGENDAKYALDILKSIFA